MQIKVKIAQKKLSYRWQDPLKFIMISRKQYEVIGVTEIILDTQHSLDILVQPVKVDIGKELRCEVAKRDTLTGFFFKTIKYVLEKSNDSTVANALRTQFKQAVVPYACEEFTNIALKHPDCLRVVS